ncbi:transposase [Rhodoblastus sphagnicola]|nr:transposase [Rhodoblastus sphagnicola]
MPQLLACGEQTSRAKNPAQVAGFMSEWWPASNRNPGRLQIGISGRIESEFALLPFLSAQPPCLVVMEACGSPHHWGREIQALGHDVRLIAPAYVKPFVKRQKNDIADAEAIAEAASRPTMRFVAVKSVEKQASAMVFKTRDLLVRQRTQTVNALRGHLAEYGVIAPQGLANLDRLVSEVRSSTSGLPAIVTELSELLLEHIAALDERIANFDRQLREQVRTDETAKRLTTVPGIGPICAAAIVALAPSPEIFAKGRDFAAWLGLTPRQHSTGGKARLGAVSRMGQRDLRRLLIIGAMSVVRWAARRGAPAGSWLARMLAKKPRMLVATALANKMARVVWALLAHGGIYEVPAAA